jgi:hypothetical protein
MAVSTLNSTTENPILQEIHHSTIRAHHAKAGYDYPTIRLPFSFSGLIGLPTRIYQTVHEGALAFLVVVSPAPNVSESSLHSVFTRRGSGVRISSSQSVFVNL